MTAMPSEVDTIKAHAQLWFDREMARAAAAHGERWPEHRAWVEDYLREELRQRLAARGWSPGDEI